MFDDMTWPFPGQDLHALEDRLRHDEADSSRHDRLLAASVLGAYDQLVRNTQRERNFVCKHLQLALKKEIDAQS